MRVVGPHLLCLSMEALLSACADITVVHGGLGAGVEAGRTDALLWLVVRAGDPAPGGLAVPSAVPPRRIVLVTDGAEGVLCAAAAGVASFVALSDTLPTLRQALRAATVGRSFCSPPLLPALLRAAQASAALPGRLSAREQEVARFAARGLSNEEIAALHHVSVATVKFHLGQVFRKLGVQRRAQLHWALPPDPSTRK